MSTAAVPPAATAGAPRFQRFEFLTGDNAIDAFNGKSYKDLYKENCILRDRIRQNPTMPGLVPPKPQFLVPPEQCCLRSAPVYDRKHTHWPERYFASCGKDKAGYSFYAFQTEQDYIKMVSTAIYPRNLFNNLVEPAYPCRFYMDLEEEYPKLGTKDPLYVTPLQFFDRCVVALTFVLCSMESLFGIDLSYRSVSPPWFTNASLPIKNSFHINLALPFMEISNSLHTAMHYVRLTLDAMRISSPDHPIVKALLKSNVPEAKNPHTPPNPWIIDFTVYNDHRSFRTALQMKTPSKNNPLVPFDHVLLKPWVSGDVKNKAYWVDPKTLEERELWVKRTMVQRSKDAEMRYRLPLVSSTNTQLMHKLCELFKPGSTAPVDNAAGDAIMCVIEAHYARHQAAVTPLAYREQLAETVECLRHQVRVHLENHRRKTWFAIRLIMYGCCALNIYNWPFTGELMLKYVMMAKDARDVADELQVWARCAGMIGWDDCLTEEERTCVSSALPLESMDPNQVAEFALLAMRLSFMFCTDSQRPDRRTKRPFIVDHFLRLYPYGYKSTTVATATITTATNGYSSDDDETTKSEKERRVDGCWYAPDDEEHSRFYQPEWRQVAQEWFVQIKKLQTPAKPLKTGKKPPALKPAAAAVAVAPTSSPPPQRRSGPPPPPPPSIVMRSATAAASAAAAAAIVIETPPPAPVTVAAAAPPPLPVAISSSSSIVGATFVHEEISRLSIGINGPIYYDGSIFSCPPKISVSWARTDTTSPHSLTNGESAHDHHQDAESFDGTSDISSADTRKRVPAPTNGVRINKKPRSASP